MTDRDLATPSPADAPTPPAESGALNRTITLPLLVFYGLGVTVGAGIFALIGEIVGKAGSRAPLAFAIAGLIAAFTGLSYSALVRRFPVAGGEAVYVDRGVGSVAGRIAGLGVVATGVISSAAIAVAFGGYVETLIDLPVQLTAAVLVALLGALAMWGLRESIVLAAVVTLLEVGTLVVVASLGFDRIGVETITASFDGDVVGFSAVIAAAGIAFFAFIGFEDIANMAEETVDPRRVAPRAIVWTLSITIAVYVALALVATAAPEPQAIAESSAPMAELFEQLAGRSPEAITTIAAFAMVNGILVQIVMASRVLYGMANDAQLPRWFADVHPKRRTPIRATAVVSATIMVLTFLPLVELARATSVVTLSVFTLVNAALWRLLRDEPGDRGWKLNAALGVIASAALAVWQVIEFF